MADSIIGFDILSYEIASESDFTPCTKIDNPLVVNRFSNFTL